MVPGIATLSQLGHLHERVDPSEVRQLPSAERRDGPVDHRRRCRKSVLQSPGHLRFASRA